LKPGLVKKNLFLLVITLFYSSLLFSQIAINMDGSAPDPSAALEIDYTNKGFLPPRMNYEALHKISSPADGLMVYCTDCGINGLGAMALFMSGEWYIFSLNCLNPVSPSSGTHIPSRNQIIWNWDTVSGATGYRWCTTIDYDSAIDVGTNTTLTDTGLTCGSSYIRYVWTYNSCGISSPLTLTQNTSDCAPFSCGDSIMVHHIEGNVAPVDKTVTYGTVSNVPGDPTKCWMTSNLGADQQATSKSDNSEASAGWYWQFNRKQGYKHDGTTRAPGTAWITEINEYSVWIAAEDPCTLELGTGWRIPTKEEWEAVDAGPPAWTNYNGPWNSILKIHLAGRLNNNTGALEDRGAKGFYWSSSQTGLTTTAFCLYFNPSTCASSSYSKAFAKPIRCLMDE
jgi:hypothetical protein